VAVRNQICGLEGCDIRSAHYHHGQNKPEGDYVDLPPNMVVALEAAAHLGAQLEEALEILAIALPGARPWPTEDVEAKLRIYRNMAVDRRRSDVGRK